MNESDGPDAPKRSVNPYEIVLWVLSAVLVVGSAGLTFSLTKLLYSGYSSGNCDADGNCGPPPDIALAQAMSQLAPAAFTAGLVLAGIALAIRAMDVTLRRASAGTPEPGPGADSHSDPGDPQSSSAVDSLSPGLDSSAPGPDSPAIVAAAPWPAQPRPTDRTESGSVTGASGHEPHRRPRDQGAPDYSAFKRPSADTTD